MSLLNPSKGFLVLPHALTAYLLGLPRDYFRLTLILLRLARFEPGRAPSGVWLEAGEALIALRSDAIWEASGLLDELNEGARMSLLRRVLDRLSKDGIIKRRPARPTDMGGDTGSNTVGGTPATIVRFLKYRENIWPSSAGPTQEAAPAPTPLAGTIQSIQDNNNSNSRSEERAHGPGESSSQGGGALLLPAREVRELLERVAAAYEVVKGVRYQHADTRAVEADRKAARALLALPLVSPEDILCAWRHGIAASEWPRIASLADLARHWIHVAGDALRQAPAVPTRPQLPSCQLWDAASIYLRNARPDWWERFIAPLAASMEGPTLRLEAPDTFLRNFLLDSHLETLQAAILHGGATQAVRLEICARDAAEQATASGSAK